MKIRGIIWLEEIADKLVRKHFVQQHEVVELFEGEPHFRFVENGHRPGENVYVAMGTTDVGRHLVVFFVYKTDQRILILSARDMSQAERRLYAKR